MYNQNCLPLAAIPGWLILLPAMLIAHDNNNHSQLMATRLNVINAILPMYCETHYFLHRQFRDTLHIIILHHHYTVVMLIQFVHSKREGETSPSKKKKTIPREKQRNTEYFHATTLPKLVFLSFCFVRTSITILAVKNISFRRLFLPIPTKWLNPLNPQVTLTPPLYNLS